ncbi:hypothetical protein LVY72_03400 [Arthrobacter sp. I2-34]|uniref:Uncharacterized protein n=1 Tax=Arthrobacter hankyongi TaxID=2904801 RepID=A0ABS9L308_9MICC|nr:hypothetical protein [Arthrobacter hankyongi]MCG2620958.1 hypothetical protein [Arthrobacter hankyongi]
MSTEDQRAAGEGSGGPTGSTVPDAPDGVGVGATNEPNTFEPEEAAPAAGRGGGQPADVPAPDEAAGPAEEQDKQEPDDRGLTTDTTPSD